ncbi:MAG: MFS transporter, partial [Bacteroidaceae bacterium]|nr:MFS transporter [Bacteroidaceae bacterium]
LFIFALSSKNVGTMAAVVYSESQVGKANETGKDKLFTRSYIYMCLANFLMAFSFFLLVPTLPFYLVDTFALESDIVGLVLSCYVIAVLCIRPFSGAIADIFPRKKVYVISYILFAVSFIGYMFVYTDILIFILLRVVHGFAFGALNTTGNTLVIDIMPSSRRGEGLGYFGVTNNLAMAFGPMTGLFLIDGGSYGLLFFAAFMVACMGLLFAAIVKVKWRQPLERVDKLFSVDRFILLAGIPASVAFFMLAVPYGMTSSYIALYASEVGITSAVGLFFTVQGAGLIVSRLLSGKRVDKGYITQTISCGILIALLGVIGEAALSLVCGFSIGMGYALYFLSAFLIGYGFGTIFPAFNTLFINMAPHSRRATANATYLTGWDVGIGAGMLLGGALSVNGYSGSFAFSAILVIAAMVYFVVFVAKHFQRHRLR